jgi:hypothetical protein
MDYFFRKIVYGNSYIFCFIRDKCLEFFKNADYIGNEILYTGSEPPEQTEVLEFLESEEMIKFEKQGVRITQKGKEMRDTGGYRRQLFFKRITFLAIITAAICAIATFAITLYH